MIYAIMRVFVWFLVGEIIVRSLAIPVPGAVVGLILFAAELSVRTMPADVARLADGVLPHLTLVFVPAGVGAVAHLHELSADLVPIVGALFGGTLVTVLVTSIVVQFVAGRDAAGALDRARP